MAADIGKIVMKSEDLPAGSEFLGNSQIKLPEGQKVHIMPEGTVLQYQLFIQEKDIPAGSRLHSKGHVLVPVGKHFMHACIRNGSMEGLKPVTYVSCDGGIVAHSLS